jgi:hypothetical protein
MTRIDNETKHERLTHPTDKAKISYQKNCLFVHLSAPVLQIAEEISVRQSMKSSVQNLSLI